MAAALTLITTLLIGFFWMYAQAYAARREFPGDKERKTWLGVSLVAFLLLAGVWLAGAGTGLLSRFEIFPPPIMPFFIFLIVSAVVISRSPLGTILVKHVPLWALVGFQAFRFLAEGTLLAGYYEGLTPRQLTFHGYNFDVVTAITAASLAVSLRKSEKLFWVRLWNFMGMGFLVVIAFIAMTSMPTPLRVFYGEPSNVWVTQVPYVLVPGIMVTSAWVGHFLVIRKLKFLVRTAK